MALSPALLTASRIRAYCTILLLVECLLLAFFAAGTHGWIVSLQTPTTTDFASFYAAGALAWSGHAASAYDQSIHYAVEQAFTQSGIEYQFFFYPPIFLLLLAPLSGLPYLVAFYVFELGTLACYLLAIRPIIVGRAPGWWIAVLAYPSVFWTFGLGQNTFLTAALFATGLRLLPRQPWVAGALLGAICYKPHLGVLIPVALLAGRQYRAFLAAGVSVGTLVLATVALFGIQPWLMFVDNFLTSSDVFSSGRINLGGVITPFATLRLLGIDPKVATVLQAIDLVLAGSIVWRVWRRPAPFAFQAACLIAATLLAVPVLLLYDLVLAQLALAWLLSQPRTRLPGWLPIVTVAVTYLVPILCRPVAALASVQIGPAAAILLVVWAVRGAWTDRTRREPDARMVA